MSDYYGWQVVLWLLIGAAPTWLRLRLGRPGVGLVAAYAIYLAWIHWVPAVLYLLPWYQPLYNAEIVGLGFTQSLIGVIGFAAGALTLSIWGKRPGETAEASELPSPALSDRRWPTIFMAMGLAGLFVLTPLIGHIPTIGVVASVSSNLLYAGAISLWWQSNEGGRWRIRLLLLLIAGIWPLVTVSSWGFLGAGLILPTLLFLFVARTARWPTLVVLTGSVMVYLAFSLAVSYSANREFIRAVVWNEQASQQEQISASLIIFERFQWFDARNERHLSRVELHTNQNHLVGLAVARHNRGYYEYVNGRTVGDALLMLVPRALWSAKPVRIGGSAYITQFTGILFYGGTSVGMGQIMEFYVNFGSAGVFLGMFLFGLAIAALDEASAAALRQHNWLRFALWYVPAVSLLQTGNNLNALLAGYVSSWLTIYLFTRYWLARKRKRVARFTPVKLGMGEPIGGNPAAGPIHARRRQMSGK